MSDKRRDLLLEIGCEELPPVAVASARRQLGGLAAARLAEARLPAASTTCFATPRRLVLLAHGLPPRQEAEVKSLLGPPRRAAYDEEGKLTAAGGGFLKKWGLKEKDLRLEETPKGPYLAAEVASPRRDAADVLAEVLPRVISDLSFPKTMAWPQADVVFPRPIRWLVCLFGGEALPLVFAGLTAGDASYGHRTLAPGAKSVATVFADGALNVERLKEFYREALGVIIDAEGRGAAVLGQLREAEVPPDYFEAADYHVIWTFERVLDQIENPTVVLGSFGEEYLALPAEVVEATMLGYLHLFPLKNARGELEPRFFAVSNARPQARDNVRAGLERVLEARLADAEYFWKVDTHTPLEDMAAALKGVVFAEGAGTVADKSARLAKLAAALAEELEVTAEKKSELARAAELCKADLTSQMVREKEFSHLQGIMGRLYAEAAGESAAVAAAIGEHYRPVAADDPLPATTLGRILSLADRLDTLVTLFAAGHRPTGAKDPFALRRAAIGLCRLLLEDKKGTLSSLALSPLVETAAALAHEPDTVLDLYKFIETRLRQIFKERGFRDDMIEAVLAVPNIRPADARRRLEALASFYENKDEYIKLVIAFKRPINILRQARAKGLTWDKFNTDLIKENEEGELHDIYYLNELRLSDIAKNDYKNILGAMAGLRPTVDKFFDEVMVMCEDEKLRANRLALMQLLADLFLSFADFAKLRGEEEYE